MVMGLPDQWDTCSRTMMFEDSPDSFAHCGDIMAIGLGQDVVLLDSITGIRTSILLGHTGDINTLAFSQDGRLLMSKSGDDTVRVWDIQTGGVVRTFGPDVVGPCASISSDGAMVALGTDDGTVRLCDVRTEKCNTIIIHPGTGVKAIQFSPINPRRFISSSEGGIVGHWDIDGDQIGPSYNEEDDGVDLAWTRDGTRFFSCTESVATVRDAESGAVVVKIDVPDESLSFTLSCFSPDGRFLACACNKAIFVWDITISGARLVRHLVGHSDFISFLAFSSSLISGSYDQSMKFWESGSFSMDLTTSDQMAAPVRPHTIQSIKLFAEEGMVVTWYRGGVVKIWDLVTGRCKSSFSTPAKGKRDTHLAGDTLIIVWYTNASADGDTDAEDDRDESDEEDTFEDADEDTLLDGYGDTFWDTFWGRNTVPMEYRIWDVYKGRLLRKFHNSLPWIWHLKISGDGSKIFALGSHCIAALSMETGEELGRVEFGSGAGNTFFVRGSKVGVDDSRRKGWDFGGPGVPDFVEFPDGPQLNLVGWKRDRDIQPCWMEDIVTKRKVFRLPEKYGRYGRRIKWDGRYLFNWSRRKEDIVIIDFGPVCPRLRS